MECSATYKQEISGTSHVQTPSERGNGPDFDSLNFFNDDTDWQGLENELQSHDWAREFRSLTPEQMYIRLVKVTFDMSKDYVPRKARCMNRRSTSKIPRERRNLMRRRGRIHKQLQNVKSDIRQLSLRNEARDIEKKLKKSYDSDRADNEHKAVSAIKKNIKYFYSYAKKFSRLKTGVGPLVDDNDNSKTVNKWQTY